MSNPVPWASALPLDEVISLLQLPFLPVTRPSMLVLLASSSASPPASVIYQDRGCVCQVPKTGGVGALGQGLMSRLEGKARTTLSSLCPFPHCSPPHSWEMGVGHTGQGCHSHGIQCAGFPGCHSLGLASCSCAMQGPQLQC